MKFRQYYIGVLVHPKRTFQTLLDDPRHLKFGLLALLINAVLYTLVYVFLTIGNGAPSVFVPWLGIPREVYYFYDRFLVAPSMFAGWILAAGIGQLLARLSGGKGSYEHLAALFGFAISAACLASLVHDLPDSFLGAVGVLDLREYEIILNSPTIWRGILLTLYSISFLWFIVLFTKAVEVAHGLRRGRAFVIGFVAYSAYQILFLVFNR